MKALTFISSVIVIILLIAGAINEYITSDWKDHQSDYYDHLSEHSEDVEFTIDYRQAVLPHLDRIDRCVICHVGITDPTTEQLDNPIKIHPGDYLDIHDPNVFGCTICHDGQGRATDYEHAVAHFVSFWDEPVLDPPYLEANCARCHRSDMPVLSGSYQRGERLFIENGCQGCHTVQGQGGSSGPDLTNIGRESFHLKRPHDSHSHDLIDKFNGNVNLAYIYEAVKQPKIQPDSSQMIDYGFTEEEALDLTVYLKSLQNYDIPENMIAYTGFAEETPRDLYMRYCSACHGKKGKGTNLAELGKLGPALGNPQFLAIADHDFLSAIISGSGSSVMPAWGAGGGLSEDNISKIADYVISLRKKAPDYEEVLSEKGIAKYGQVIFNANCSGCHGIDAEYEIDMIGPTLKSPQLLSLRNREQMFETIVTGRAGTAMPGWNFLTKQDLADIMEYTDTWRSKNVSFSSFKTAVANGSRWRGERHYIENCAACHGNDKEGGIGPSLNSPEFLAMANNSFMYKTITQGRMNTAMAGYTYLGAKTLGDIVKYLRSGFNGSIVGTSRAKVNGSEFEGEKLFARICAQCHGSDGSGNIGPAIASSGFLDKVTDEFIWKTAAYGRSGTAMKGNLKGQGGTAALSKKELNNIVSYIRTYEKNPPQLTGRSTISGNYLTGKDDFKKFCAQCHGDGGAGGNGPAIGKKGFLEANSDGFILAMMMSGRDGSEMKKFGRGGLVELDADQALSIAYYLRHKPESDIGTKYIVGTPQIGEELYKSQCRQCHQKGSFAPDLRRPDFVKAASVGYLQATMSLGRHQSAMRSMIRGGGGLTELTGQEINDIIAFIKQGKDK